MSSEVQRLLDTITNAVNSLNQTCSSEGTSVPNINEPFEPSSEKFRSNFEAMQAARIIGAAALQLEAIVAPPQVVLWHVAGGVFKSMALRICLESHVTEILRDAGKDGMHIQDIAKRNDQDPQKLARFLRYLCSNHVYREVSPDVFANNRISSLLDTEKSFPELHSKSLDKYQDTHGVAGFVSLYLDEGFKGAAYGWETLSDPAMAGLKEHLNTPLNKAFNMRLPYYDFIQREDQRGRRLRFDSCMEGVEKAQLPDIVQTFEWSKLPVGSKVVDVGGGIGNVFFPLPTKFPELEIVIQDLPNVIENAKKTWSERMPEALETGQVKLEAHNFFDAQPQKGASVYFVKHVLHNWSDSSCVEMLKRLRDASNDATTLIIMDNAMPYVCRSQENQAEGDSHLKTATISGLKVEEAPEPLLANYGALSEVPYVIDMAIFTLFNTQERTFSQLNDLLNKAGWIVSSVRRKEGDLNFVQIQAKLAKTL